jgi:hypothetical protein
MWLVNWLEGLATRVESTRSKSLHAGNFALLISNLLGGFYTFSLLILCGIVILFIISVAFLMTEMPELRRGK